MESYLINYFISDLYVNYKTPNLLEIFSWKWLIVELKPNIWLFPSNFKENLRKREGKFLNFVFNKLCVQGFENAKKTYFRYFISIELMLQTIVCSIPKYSNLWKNK